MAVNKNSTIVGVFENHENAQSAVKELSRRGFTDSQLGVAGHDYTANTAGTARRVDGEDDSESYAGEGAAAGLATGAGVGALWGLGIIAGAIPAIGPAIAGGTLAAILSSAAAGAAAAGVAGGLIGLGVSKDEADYYDAEYRAGRTLVTVSAVGREDEVRQIMQEFGAYDMTSRPGGSASTGATRSRGALPGNAADTDSWVQAHSTEAPRR